MDQGRGGEPGSVGSPAASVKNPNVYWKEKWGREEREVDLPGELESFLKQKEPGGEGAAQGAAGWSVGCPVCALSRLHPGIQGALSPRTGIKASRIDRAQSSQISNKTKGRGPSVEDNCGGDL